MKKTLIHSFQVKTGFEKIQFQIKLPRNTKRVNSIKITTNGFNIEIEEILKKMNAMEDEYYKKIFQSKLEDNNYKVVISQTEKKIALENSKNNQVNSEQSSSKSNSVVRLAMIEIPEQEIGSLWLRIPERRDVLFSEIVKIPIQQFGLIGYNRAMNILPSFGKGKEWVDGAKESFFSIDIDPTSTIIEGFYSNLLKDLNVGYQINIYLNLEL